MSGWKESGEEHYSPLPSSSNFKHIVMPEIENEEYANLNASSSTDEIPGPNSGIYDEFIKRSTPELIDVNTKIRSNNKGFVMLTKLGWNDGQPLGLSPDARVEPIPFVVKQDSTGLGKLRQDVQVIESTVSQRRELDSERQTHESDDQRRARVEKVAQQSSLKNEISATLKPFFCALCDKQFKNVTQYDEHTNSYAHAHKARAKDMQLSLKLKPTDVAQNNERKEKERKREERELRKIAKAAGVKLAGAGTPTTLATPLPSSALSGVHNKEFRNAGWSSVVNPGTIPRANTKAPSTSQ